MILSDRSIREELAAGRIVIEPLNEAYIQPSSVDLTIDRYFRVFRNHTMRVIDVKEDQEELTELVEIQQDDVFILHPGEFVLGSTAERVALPPDLVARLEGKSSLGRLGLLIHSSLPASEEILVRRAGRIERITIGDLVGKQVEGEIIAFDPKTFEVGYHAITGWYEGPADRIFEIRLASGRRVRVTAGHNLFTLDRDGAIEKVRTGALAKGMRVAVPLRIPEPGCDWTMRVTDFIPEAEWASLTVAGPTIERAFVEERAGLTAFLVERGYGHAWYYARDGKLPMHLAAAWGLLDHLTDADRICIRGGRKALPAVIEVDEDFAWLLGMYVAEGSNRRGQLTISNTRQHRLDRLTGVCDRLGLPVHRSLGAITVTSSAASMLMDWLGTGRYAENKRVPAIVFGWDDHLVAAFLEGLVDGDGSRDRMRTSVWTSSSGLAADVLILAARLGRRAGTAHRKTRSADQVYIPENEHKLLTSIPLPDRLLVRLRDEAGLAQNDASRRAGYRHASDLNNIENRTNRDAVRINTLRRLWAVYGPLTEGEDHDRLHRLVAGDLAWDTVVEVIDTGEVETIYDIEVRPDGRKIENFMAGAGGVLVSNTAGFVDAGWDGHLTLELSNVANLPITLYPGMKIGQISFLRMTTEADTPYGSKEVGSKYQGQRGPTPSRYFENFKPRS